MKKGFFSGLFHSRDKSQEQLPAVELPVWRHDQRKGGQRADGHANHGGLCLRAHPV
jgi:hypothetical protein